MNGGVKHCGPRLGCQSEGGLCSGLAPQEHNRNYKITRMGPVSGRLSSHLVYHVCLLGLGEGQGLILKVTQGQGIKSWDEHPA